MSHRPFSSLMVAYLLFAKGHDCLLQSPVTLYSFLQKFFVSVLKYQVYIVIKNGAVYSKLTVGLTGTIFCNTNLTLNEQKP